MSEVLDLEPALDGIRHTVDTPDDTAAERVVYYQNGPAFETADQPPLVFVHSVNAAASAYEVKPLYDHYAGHRPVIALDLPGYGLSARPAIRYTPRVMIDAINHVLDDLVARGATLPVDVMALSLSCEFVARAANERPSAFRTIGFISPTGFAGKADRRGTPESNRGVPWVYRSVTASDRIGRGLFSTLTSRPSIRYFLQKTWGSKEIDEGAFAYAHATADQPGARHAPFSFLSGYLFSNDINDVYDRLEHPVWMGHGQRGDFTDYRRKVAYGDKPNWRIDSYPTGALPHFEILERLTGDYDAFVATGTATPSPAATSLAL